MNEIRLYGPIGGYSGLTPEGILDQVPEGATEVVLRVHSPGGSVGDGLAMYNALKDSTARVVAIVDGYAASSASFVMLAADEVRVHESSLVFLHKPWSGAQGNADDMRKSADDLDKHEDAIIAIYTRKTGKTVDEIKEVLKNETFLTGAEAIEMGLADVLIDDPEAELEIAALLKVDAKLTEEIMSTQKTRRDIQAELDETKAGIESERIEAQAKIDEAQAALLEKDTAIESAQAEALASATLATETGEKLTTAQAEIVDLTAKAEDATAQIEAHAEIVKGYEAKLSSPAYIDAAMTEAKIEEQTRIDAEADEAEKAAEAKAKEDAPKNILDEYNAMAYGAERRKFYNANRRAILNYVGETDNA